MCDLHFVCVYVCVHAHVHTLSHGFVTLWTVAHWAPLSMGFSRQELWDGLPFPPPGDLPNPGIKPVSAALAGRFFPTEPPGNMEAHISYYISDNYFFIYLYFIENVASQ